jgi:succinoglycan biosynthesis transport protein ExoP
MQTEAKVGDLLRDLRRSYLMIATTMVVGTILICAGPALIPPRYTAKSQILVEPQGLMAPQGSVIELPADEAAMQTEVAALTSPGLLQRMLDGLSTDPAFQTATTVASGKTESFEDKMWGYLTGWAPRAWFTATGEPGPVSIRQLLRHLQVSQETGSHVIVVSVTSISAEEAAAIANRLTRLYVEGQDQQKRASTDRTLVWLAGRVPELKDEVRRLDASVQAYRVAHNLADANPKGISDGQIDDLNRQLAAGETEVAVARARADIVNKLLRANGGAGAVAGYVNSPSLSKLHERELALLQILAASDHVYAAGSSLMNKVRGELTEVRQQLTQEADRAVADLDHDVQIATARVQSIRQRLIAVRSDRTDVSLADLERDAASSHRLYENLLLRQEQLKEQRESLSPGVRILSVAQPPIRPSSISPILFAPPAAILSFIFASFLAIGKAHNDRTLRSEREVREVLGLSCLGLVPQVRRLRGTRPHHYLLSQRFSPYAEAIKSLVAALHVSKQERDPKVLLFSSSVPAEGKTTLAVSVAVYLATLGRRVVIVDLDFRRPAIVRELGGKVNRSLLDLLNQGGPIADAVQRVNGLPLDFLVAPRGIPNEPLSLFASDNMARLIQRLRSQYDHVVIDSAPLLAIAEARLLVSLADKTLFVVEWGKTRREVALNALNLLPAGLLDGQGTQQGVSAVVSRVNLKKHARYNYGDSGQCLIEYGSYFSDTGKAPSR